MKGVQCYELFGGIALKNHASSFFFGFAKYPFVENTSGYKFGDESGVEPIQAD